MSFFGLQFAADADTKKLVDSIPQSTTIQSQNSSNSYRINTEADGEREMTQDEVNKLVHDALRRARKATTPKHQKAMSPLSITSSRSGLSSMGGSPSQAADSRASNFSPTNHLDRIAMSNSSDPSHADMHALLSPTMDSLAEETPGSIRNVHSLMSTNSSDSVLRKVEEEIANARQAAMESTQKLKHLATPQGSMVEHDPGMLVSPGGEDNLADMLDDQFRDDEDLHNILDTNDSEDQFDTAMNDMGSEFANGTPTPEQANRSVAVASPVLALPMKFGYQPEPGAVAVEEEQIDESLEMSLDQSQKYRSADAAESPETSPEKVVATTSPEKAVTTRPPLMKSKSRESPRIKRPTKSFKQAVVQQQHDTPVHSNHANYVDDDEGAEAVDHVLQNMPSMEDDEKKVESPKALNVTAPVESQTKSLPVVNDAEQVVEQSASSQTARSEEVAVVEEEAIEVKPSSSNGIVNQNDSDFTEVTVTEDEITRIGSTVVMSSETSDCTEEEVEDGGSEYTEETVEDEEETIEEPEEEPSAREVTIEGVPESVSPEKASPLKQSPLKASPQKQSPQKMSPRKTSPQKASPQKSMAVPKSKSESSDPVEPQEKENTPAKEERPAMEESNSETPKAAVTASSVFTAKPAKLAVDTKTKKKIKFRHPYPYPPPLPKPRQASAIIKENATGIPDQFTTWSDARPELEKLLLAACGDSLPRRSNACGALKVLSQQKKNQLALVRTKGFLDALVFAVSAAIPNNHDTEIALDARGRAVSTLLNVAVPKGNRSLVLVHPGVAECLLKVIDDDQGEARAQACAALATLAKTPGNRECMAKKDRLLDVLANVLIGSMDEEDFESSMDEDEEKKAEEGSAEFEDEEGITSAEEGFGSTSFSTNNTDGEDGTNFDDDGLSLGVSSSMSSIQPPGKGRTNHKSIRSQKDELHEQFLKEARVNSCAALMHLTKQCAISIHVANNQTVVLSLVMVGRESDNPIHTKCIEMICNLSRFPANTAKLARNDALIDTLIKGGKSKNLDDRIWSMRSLQNIASDSNSKVILANSRILTLLSICSMRKDYEEQVAAVAALYNLSTEPGAVVPLTNTRNVVATLVHLAHNAISTPEIRKMACDALATIGLWLQTLAGSGSVPTGIAGVPLPSHQTTGWQLWDRDQ